MNFPENWVLQIDPAVFKALKKFPRKDAENIHAVIYSLPQDPYAGDIRKLGGEADKWRRRVGSYRISYKILPLQRIILVVEVKRRTTSTY